MTTTTLNRAAKRLPKISPEKGNEILGFLLAAFVVLLLGSLASYHPLDPSWLHRAAAGEADGVRNFVGPFGAQLAAISFSLLGLVSLLLPVLLGFEAWRRLRGRGVDGVSGRSLGLALVFLVLPALIQLVFDQVSWRGEGIHSGGALGVVVAGILTESLNTGGAFVVLSAVLLMGGSLVARSTLGDVFGVWRQHAAAGWQRVVLSRAQYQKRRDERSTRRRVLKRHLQDHAEERERRDAAVASSAPARTPRVSRPGAVQDPGLVVRAAPPPERIRVTEKKGVGHFAVRKVMAAPTAAPTADVPPAAPLAAAEPHYAPPRPRAPQPAPVAPPTQRRPAPAEVETVAPARTGTIELPPARQEDLAFRPEEVAPPELPPINLLNTDRPERVHDEADLVQRGEVIRTSTEHFGVAGEIAGISPGPVITVYAFRPGPGVKVSKVVNLQDDLALALKAESVRIDRIPGRSTMGLEVPNDKRSIIHLGQLLTDERFEKAPSVLTMAMGVDIHGEPVYCDLATMPHLLVAGATGAGKSVGLQAMITSILYKATRDQVQFIFIDPKRIELGVYSDIPHLKTEVVMDPKKAANALRWAVAEMERRYRLLAEVHVRSIAYYNRAIKDPKERERLSLKEGESEFNADDFKPLPYYVIIIDELADLMMVASSDVETSIARLAQMARAVGIHLIIATQRPSVDVLTGTIKANFPCRLAFATASRHDSRTILDQVGAEKLLGKGDALFMPPGTSRIQRLHGAYISEQETAGLIRWLKRRGKPDLDPDVVKAPEEEASNSGGGGGGEDDLFEEAARLVVQERMGSASFLQRRMRVGFSRAARLIDMMEADGLLGPSQGSKPREVLVPADYFDEIDRARQGVEA
ncbi:MAG: DNA translocase FtsK [Acidobacteriota bacterium]